MFLLSDFYGSRAIVGRVRILVRGGLIFFFIVLLLVVEMKLI